MPKSSPFPIRCITSVAKFVASIRPEWARPMGWMFARSRASENFRCLRGPAEYCIFWKTDNTIKLSIAVAELRPSDVNSPRIVSGHQSKPSEMMDRWSYSDCTLVLRNISNHNWTKSRMLYSVRQWHEYRQAMCILCPFFFAVSATKRWIVRKQLETGFWCWLNVVWCRSNRYNNGSIGNV